MELEKRLFMVILKNNIENTTINAYQNAIKLNGYELSF